MIISLVYGIGRFLIKYLFYKVSMFTTPLFRSLLSTGTIYILFFLFVTLHPATVQSQPAPQPPAQVTLTGQLTNFTGFLLPNVWGTSTFWDWHTFLIDPIPSAIHTYYPWLQEIELFTATGGCYEGYPGCESNRDLFNDPTIGPASGYNFTLWLKALRNIVNTGLNVYIVTANIPISLSTKPTIGGFNFNSALPNNYTEYYNYMYALGTALVNEFGTEIVSQFKFGVFTEFNNLDWLNATSEEYFQLYDYTACALEDVLGIGNVRIGGHACTQCEPGIHGGNAWHAADLLQHVVNGPNYCDSKRTVPLKFLTDSFYETRPGSPGDLNWFYSDVVPLIQSAQSTVQNNPRLNGLIYGIDEGRILLGPETEGPNLALTTRAVGATYQASFDALLLKLMLYNNMSWYSRWNINSDMGTGLWSFQDNAVDTVATNVAHLTYRMYNGQLVNIRNESSSTEQQITNDGNQAVDGIVTYHSTTRTVRILGFNHYARADDTTGPSALFSLHLCGLSSPNTNQSLVTNLTRIDANHSQFWDTWWNDKISNNITKVNGGWSAYSDGISFDVPENQTYFTSRVPYYQSLATLQTLQTEDNVVLTTNGCIVTTNPLTIPTHGVILLEIMLPA